MLEVLTVALLTHLYLADLRADLDKDHQWEVNMEAVITIIEAEFTRRMNLRSYVRSFKIANVVHKRAIYTHSELDHRIKM